MYFNWLLKNMEKYYMNNNIIIVFSLLFILFFYILFKDMFAVTNFLAVQLWMILLLIYTNRTQKLNNDAFESIPSSHVRNPVWVAAWRSSHRNTSLTWAILSTLNKTHTHLRVIYFKYWFLELCFELLEWCSLSDSVTEIRDEHC